LIDKRRHSNILDVLSFRGADCDSDHYLVITKLRERISLSKRGRQKFDVEWFYLKELDDVEVNEKYQVEISNRFAALESLDGILTLIMLGRVLEKTSRPEPKIT
jgi:hypothetical protein